MIISSNLTTLCDENSARDLMEKESLRCRITEKSFSRVPEELSEEKINDTSH